MISDEAIIPGFDVYHKEYGTGTVVKVTADKIIVTFDCGSKIFPYPESLLKGYLTAHAIKLEPTEKTTLSRPTEKISIPAALAELLDMYYDQFPARWDQEKYIWKAVQTFQNHWDPDATDFSKMIFEATADADYLMNASLYYPREMIVGMARKEPSYVASMFKSLFDESIAVSIRAEKFYNDADRIRTNFKGTYYNRNFQTMNAVSTFLWLMYPNNYYFYKVSVARKVSSQTGLSYEAGSTEVEKMISQFILMDKISAALRQDHRSRELLDPRLDESLYYDDQLHCMAMDFAFFIRPCYASRKS